MPMPPLPIWLSSSKWSMSFITPPPMAILTLVLSGVNKCCAIEHLVPLLQAVNTSSPDGTRGESPLALLDRDARQKWMARPYPTFQEPANRSTRNKAIVAIHFRAKFARESTARLLIFDQ